MTLLKNYVKFVVIEVALGGYTIKRKASELYLGCDFQFIRNIK
jgi:hypothetical protein